MLELMKEMTVSKEFLISPPTELKRRAADEEEIRLKVDRCLIYSLMAQAFNSCLSFSPVLFQDFSLLINDVG